MTNWLDIFAQNTPEAWIASGITLLVLVMAALLLKFIAKRYLIAYAQRTDTTIDDVLLVVIRKTHLIIIAVIALFFAQKFLLLPEKLNQLFRIAAIAGVFLQIALWGNAIISFYLSAGLRRSEDGEVNIAARRALAYLSRAVLWVLVLALMLENLGVRLTPLLAGVGIGGIAIALAIQNILGDLFCYVAIILDKPFVAGDFLAVGDMSGSVERIGLKTTRIRSISGELLVFSNHDLVNSRIRNYKSLQERRILFTFGLTYGTPIDKVKAVPELVRSLFATVPHARLDRVHFSQLGDFSLNFEVVYFVLSGDYQSYMDVQQEINLGLMQMLRKEGIEFAYPTQTLHVSQLTDVKP